MNERSINNLEDDIDGQYFFDFECMIILLVNLLNLFSYSLKLVPYMYFWLYSLCLQLRLAVCFFLLQRQLHTSIPIRNHNRLNISRLVGQLRVIFSNYRNYL